jgi:hypothetical protein
MVHETLSRNTRHKKGLLEWLKMKALSSNPSNAKKKKKVKFPWYHPGGLGDRVLELFPQHSTFMSSVPSPEKGRWLEAL